MNGQAERLQKDWDALRARSPGMRMRDAARELGATEAELVALGCGRDVTRLRPAWAEILGRVPELARVMALTRNEAVVSEVTGAYVAPEIEGAVGQVAGDPIDLRLFLRRWAVGFAVRGPGRDGVMRSLQFFNAEGEAVHKVYLKNDEAVAAFERIAEDFAADDQSPVQAVTPRASPEAERPDNAVDVPGLRGAWAAMTNTHEFHGLLQRFGVTRTQALRLAGSAWAVPIGRDSLRPVLEQSSAREVPIMIFVGSEGVIQIRSGVVRRVKVIDGWLNVLDPDFNLHVLESAVASAWRVRKPSHGGVVTSVELFDAAGRNVMLVFGKRADGGYDAPAWRDLAETAPTGT